MSWTLRLAALIWFAGLAACTISPDIAYHKLTDSDRKPDWVTFEFTDTAIALVTTIKAPTDVNAVGVTTATKDQISLVDTSLTCTEKGCDKPLVGFASPIAFSAEVYAIAPVNHFYKKTSLAPGYRANSLLLQTLSIDTQDKREELINTLGTVAVGIAKLGLAAAAPPVGTAAPLHLPTIITLEAAKQTVAGKENPLPNNPGWFYSLQFQDDPGTAGFYQRASLTDIDGAAVTSVCRSAVVNLHNNRATLTIGVTVADPDYVMTLPLPAKGTITFGDLCNGTVKLDQATQTTTDTLAKDLFQQIDNLRTALAPKSTQAPK